MKSVLAGVPSSLLVQSCKSTVEVFVLTPNPKFIALSRNCHRKFVTVELCAVYDCDIAEYDKAVCNVRLLGYSTIVP